MDEVDFYLGDKLLGSAKVEYTTWESGKAVLNVKTADKKLALGKNVIKAVYGGSVNLNGSESETITVEMEPKLLEYSVSTQPADLITEATRLIYY